MTRTKDTIPNPSQPNKRQTRFGIKIRRFMDATKSSTVCEKRWLNLSPSIYVEAKYITLAEIKSTVEENKHPQGSKIIGRVIEVDCHVIIFQEMSIILFSENKYRAVIRGRGNRDHNNFLEIIEK